jgi:hypothetical protein
VHICDEIFVVSISIVDACQCGKAYAQRIHIGPTLKDFLALEKWYFCNGINWLSAK